MTNVLDEFAAFAKECEARCQRSVNISKPSWIRWDRDSADLHDLNKGIKELAVRLVEQNLVPQAAGSILEIGHEDVDQIAWELLEESRPQKGAQTWGNAAEAVVRAISGITALLP